MNILIITSTLPLPLDAGSKIRNFYLIKYLSQYHTIHLASLARSPVSNEHRAILGQYCKSIFIIPEPRTLFKKVRDVIKSLISKTPYTVESSTSKKLQKSLSEILSQERIDLIQIQELYVAANISGFENTIPIVLDAHNSESLILERLTKTSKSLRESFYASQAIKMARFEENIVKNVDAVFCVSEKERVSFSAINRRSYLLPNGVESISATIGRNGHSKTLLFTGSLNYTPNELGLLWFFESVLPKVQREEPEVQVKVVSRLIPRSLLRFGGKSVEFIDNCDDLSALYHMATVSIVPLHAGAGTRLKILEAFAAGVPVVSTSIGVEGIPAVHGKELLVADTAEEFAHSVVELLHSEFLQKTLSEAAMALIRREFLWKDNVLKVLPVYEELRP